MKTLYLLRHAKSAWDRSELSDHQRPLNQRGRESCLLLAEYFRRNQVKPALVLCSSAARAQETVSRIADALDREFRVEVRDDLYLAEAKRLLKILRTIDDRHGSAMLVGHNPDLGDLARQLVGEGERRKVAELAEKFPTGALATIAFTTDSWDKIKVGRGSLRDYVTPRVLAE